MSEITATTPNAGFPANTSRTYVEAHNDRGGSAVGLLRRLFDLIFPPVSECHCCNVRTDCTDCADLREAGTLHTCERAQ